MFVTLKPETQERLRDERRTKKAQRRAELQRRLAEKVRDEGAESIWAELLEEARNRVLLDVAND